MPMLLLTHQISLQHPPSPKLSKQHCLSQNRKILKVIHNKITPLNVSPKTKFKMQRKNQLRKPSLHHNFYHWKNWENRVKQYEYAFRPGRIADNQDFSYIKHTNETNQKLTKKAKTIWVQSSFELEDSNTTHCQKIDFQRLPSIKQEIQKKKIDLAKSIQHNSLQLQWDNFRPMDQEKVCNLEYLVNRLNFSCKRQDAQSDNNEPLRGYENLSPNRLKEYIEMFKKKMKVVPQSIYVSKKRIPLPKNNTEGEQGKQNPKIRLMSLKVDKKLLKVENKVLPESKKSLRKESSRRQLSRRNTSRKEISRKEIQRKEI